MKSGMFTKRVCWVISPDFSDLSSCAAIQEHTNSSTSSYYFVGSLSGKQRSVYCDMRRTCCNITRGWMRIAMLDVQNCPLELQQTTFNDDNITIFVEREREESRMHFSIPQQPEYPIF